jgi:hypothetical protein
VVKLNNLAGVAILPPGGQFFCPRFADGALSVKYLGCNSFRAEYFPDFFLSQAARLHQML